ncbi:hypothetical protein VZT92_003344 [Zoarces viviparus]|uniref:Uncharacterized protein n=1 Tax=Zoarces viviparus TaxID=48416 RepID=A0AAW1G2C9_ZOAVI
MVDESPAGPGLVCWVLLQMPRCHRPGDGWSLGDNRGPGSLSLSRVTPLQSSRSVGPPPPPFCSGFIHRIGCNDDRPERDLQADPVGVGDGSASSSPCPPVPPPTDRAQLRPHEILKTKREKKPPRCLRCAKRMSQTAQTRMEMER